MIQRLLDRRVPQLVGLYVALAWGFVQFMDWVVGHYEMSPTLINLVVAEYIPAQEARALLEELQTT